MSDPLVERLDHVGGKLTVVPGSRLRGRWMTDDFVAEYGPDVDLATVPRSVLLVPFAFNVAPVVWFSGERYVLDELDERAVESLAAIHRVLRGMYPDVAWNGELHVERAVPAPPPRPGLDEALLFSGGLDSTYSALSRPAEEQLLITMWGNDVDLSNAAGWAAVRADTEDFARTFERRATFVRGNFRPCLNLYRLHDRVPSIPSWWGNVQHGMGLIGMTAPVLHAYGIDRLVIAATRNEDYQAAWGSHPDLDENARWADVVVEHHGHDRSRQRKLEFIAQLVATGSPRPKLRVCYSDPYGAGVNCSQCEKCLRTMTGLVLEGESPPDYGFGCDRTELGRRVRDGFASHRFRLKEGQAVMWTELRDRAAQRRDLPDADGYLAWLARQDFHAYRRATPVRERARKRASRLKARGLAHAPALQPGVEASIRRLRRLRDALSPGSSG